MTAVLIILLIVAVIAIAMGVMMVDNYDDGEPLIVVGAICLILGIVGFVVKGKPNTVVEVKVEKPPFYPVKLPDATYMWVQKQNFNDKKEKFIMENAAMYNMDDVLAGLTPFRPIGIITQLDTTAMP